MAVQQEHQQQDVAHLMLEGDLDLVGAVTADRQVHAALDRGLRCLVLHLDEVRFIDSCGLRTLLAAAEAAERAGVDLRILPGPEHVMCVVEAAGLAGRLPFVGYP
jgi:stage II sporulation protein AA (anti-sigma F factor antagonist)